MRYLLRSFAYFSSYTLVNECSSGAANSEWHYYSLRGRELAVVRTILFDGRDGEDPWQASEFPSSDTS